MEVLQHAPDHQMIGRLIIAERREQVTKLKRQRRLAELAFADRVRQKPLVAKKLVNFQMLEIKARNSVFREFVSR